MAEPKSTNQRDIIVKVLRSKFHDAIKENKEQPFAVAIIGFDVDLYSLKKEADKNKKGKPSAATFKPMDVEPIKDDLLPNIVLKHQFDNAKGTLNFNSQSGMFKVTFSDGTILFFAQRLVGMGKSTGIESYAVASKQTFNKYYQYLNKQAKILNQK
jgi:hypothetical protein